VPQSSPVGAITRGESAIDLLKRVERVSSQWVRPGHQRGQNTHNVSATISIKEDEWQEVAEWMWENKSVYNGLSVLPWSDHTYVQAPFEDCTKEEYEQKLELLKEIDLTKVVEIEDNTNLTGELACAGGSCEIS
jgi:ribonucleoside-diphosphate reductase alpha chain